MGDTNATKAELLPCNQVVSCWVATLQDGLCSILLQQFLSRGRNSQAWQEVLEQLREAVIPPRKEKVVVYVVLLW